MVLPDTDTSSARVPSTVSYLSRCAIVAMSPRSFAATISMPRSPSAALAARQKLRPIRPKPLIPTRIVTVLTLLVDPRDRQRLRDYRTPRPADDRRRDRPARPEPVGDMDPNGPGAWDFLAERVDPCRADSYRD